MALALGCAFIVGLALVAYLLVKLGPRWLTDTEGLDAAHRDEALGRARTALLALVAGTIAIISALYTVRTFALNRRGQITERFSRAIEHLADERSAVRLGGIYALERIAHESAEEHGPILEVLTAYVRQNSPWPKAAGDEEAAAKTELEPPQASVEIKAILTVLARRNLRHERDGAPKLDLAQTNLRGVKVRGIDLRGANLIGAQLQGADLRDAKLDNVDLRNAALQQTNFLNARLSGSSLADAHLQGAVLTGAYLGDMTLKGAQMQRSLLFRTDLSDATLTDVDLRDARSSSTTQWPSGFDWRSNGVRQRPSD